MTPTLIIQPEVPSQSVICGISMARVSGSGQRSRNGHLRGSQVGHKEKQKSVRWNMQVEINQAMDEEAGASHQAREMQSSDKGVVQLTQSPQGFSEQNTQKPSTTESSENSGFGEGLQVVVVCVIDDSPIVERFIRWIHGLERAESR